MFAPYAAQIDLFTGKIGVPAIPYTRRLSDLKGFAADEAALQQMIEQDDQIVYEVYELRTPEESGHLHACTTIIHPGKIGDEYFFTKGHFHERRGTAEIYTCLSGEGYLLLLSPEGETQGIHMTPGTCAYIPPYWAHRTVNCGKTDFVFYGVWFADGGHDYDTIKDRGFSKILVERDGRPALVDNPKWAK